ncbi:MAG: SRPBCC domain-containing protein [Saprospiraceae bacterium]
MYAILHNLHINAKPSQVFSMISTSRGLNKWWTLEADGHPVKGERYRFYFSEEYDWAGIVTKVQIDDYIEWEMLDCDQDWNGTKVGIEIFPTEIGTNVKFYHKNWKETNDHFRDTSYGWAIYFRLLKRYIEHDEYVPFDHRENA